VLRAAVTAAVQTTNKYLLAIPRPWQESHFRTCKKHLLRLTDKLTLKEAKRWLFLHETCLQATFRLAIWRDNELRKKCIKYAGHEPMRKAAIRYVNERYTIAQDKIMAMYEEPEQTAAAMDTKIMLLHEAIAKAKEMLAQAKHEREDLVRNLLGNNPGTNNLTTNLCPISEQNGSRKPIVKNNVTGNGGFNIESAILENHQQRNHYITHPSLNNRTQLPLIANLNQIIT
jgi:hypothetical protein